MARLNFNAATVDPQKPIEVIPADWYTTQIIESDAKPTKNGAGSFLEIKLQVMGGPHNGHILYDRFNLQNANQQAVEIAYRQLSAVCHAVGVIQCEDSQQLHGRPMMTKVTVTPAEIGKDGKQYDARNEIDGYKALEQGAGIQGIPSGVKAAAPSWAQPAPAPQQAPAPAQHPWTPAQQPAPVQQQATPANSPPWAAAPVPVAAPQQPAAANTPPWAR